ncbi:hypothetical protein PENSTE_c023G04259 [Penicillium steckii]|uniref:Uncharacterized protein n=1 Tax=Penicillium steckii TaxID=303698 RepID=A0A1V6SRS3_9EURO|nr:hypothetical protein PENSTE_c023G04259 [Penicillium steckii]
MTRYLMRLYMYSIIFGSLGLTMAVALFRENPLQDIDHARRNEYQNLRASIKYAAKNTALTGHEKSHGCISTMTIAHRAAANTSPSLLSDEIMAAQSVVARKDLNWAEIPTRDEEEIIFAPSSPPTMAGSTITTNTSPLPMVTSNWPSEARNAGTPMKNMSFALYYVSISMVLASMGSVLMLAFRGWQLPPFPFI